MLRVGLPHAGRDLFEGVPHTDPHAPAPALGYLPVIKGLTRGGERSLQLIAALNLEYFREHLHSDLIGTSRISTDLIRYDGTLLLSSRADGLTRAHVAANERLSREWQTGHDTGLLEEHFRFASKEEGDGRYITVWTASRIRPLVLVSRLDHHLIASGAHAETARRTLFLLPVVVIVLGATLLAYLLLRRAAAQRNRMQRAESRRLKRLLDALPASVLLLGADGRPLLHNQGWQTTFALPETNLGKSAPCPEHPIETLEPAAPGAPLLTAGVHAVLAREREIFDGEFAHHDGERVHWYSAMVRPFIAHGERGAVVLLIDISARRTAEERNDLLVAALNASANAVVITDTDAVIQWANPAFEKLTGFSVAEATGRRPSELISSGVQSNEFYAAMWRTILAGNVWRGEVVNKHRSGRLYHESLTITPVFGRNQRQLRQFIAVKEDISERKTQQQELERLASTDPLTGVANRRSFLSRLESELARLHRYHREATLLMMDLDHFKAVNDTWGHAAGDAVLRFVTDLVTPELRKNDCLGRLGGEEFGILLAETGLEGAREFAERLRTRLEASTIPFDGTDIHVTMSIGIVTLDRNEAHAALSRADHALYRAKKNGRNRVEVLSADSSLAEST